MSTVLDGADNPARHRILARLRAAASHRPAEKPIISTRTFDWSAEERLARFSEALEAVRGEIRPVGGDWPRVLFELLKERGAANLLYGPHGPFGPALEGGWPDRNAIALQPYSEPVESWRNTLFDRISAGFTSCRAGIAETGSLVLWPDSAEPRLLSLVPPIHVALLDARDIRSTLSEVVAEQNWAGGMPTNALLVTGPSKSADIEQTLTYGVHGPATLIVLIRVD
jgi:L-lactate dehydrogenase complex protein LldG